MMIVVDYLRLLEINFTLTAAGRLTDIATNRAGIGAGALTTGRQATRVADTTVTCRVP